MKFVQARDPSAHHGTSAAALVELAHDKGYVLAAVDERNLILVADEYADIVLSSTRPALADLRDDSESIRYTFPGYDGTVHQRARDSALALGPAGIAMPSAGDPRTHAHLPWWIWPPRQVSQAARFLRQRTSVDDEIAPS